MPNALWKKDQITNYRVNGKISFLVEEANTQRAKRCWNDSTIRNIPAPLLTAGLTGASLVVEVGRARSFVGRAFSQGFGAGAAASDRRIVVARTRHGAAFSRSTGKDGVVCSRCRDFTSNTVLAASSGNQHSYDPRVCSVPRRMISFRQPAPYRNPCRGRISITKSSMAGIGAAARQ